MFTDLVYAAVLYGPPGHRPAGPAGSPGCSSVAAAIVPFALWRVPEALLIGVVVGVVAFTPAATGLIVRNHRDAADAARLRAEQTALLAEMDRTQAVTAERARMARELHDMVANHLSAIAIHSTAALSIDDPDTSKRGPRCHPGEQRGGTGRDAPPDRHPAGERRRPGTGGGADAGRPRRTGRRRPRPTGSTSPSTTDTEHGTLPAPVELAAYRIVQESLTNALKHASPGPVTVRARPGGTVR